MVPWVRRPLTSSTRRAKVLGLCSSPTRNEYQVLAAALNDHLEDLGQDNPLLY